MNESQNHQSDLSIMNQIEERIAVHRQSAGAKSDNLPQNPHVVYPGLPADIPYDLSLYQYLQQATALYPVVPRNMVLAHSSLDNVPILGHVWRSVRRQLHNIALFYINRALDHQVQINLNLAEAMVRLTILTQQQQRQIKALQQQAAHLQERDAA